MAKRIFDGSRHSQGVQGTSLSGQGGIMLIIGRKRDQKIIINDDIEITILEIGRNRVRFGVQAPKSVRIHTKLQQLPSETSKGAGEDSRTPEGERDPSKERRRAADPTRIQSFAEAVSARRSG